MKIGFLAPLLLFTQLISAQSGKHIKVPGTKCSIIPPAGFVAATAFSGFQNIETGSSIMINEIPAPYSTIADGFTSEALKTKGMTLVSKQVIDFNNSKASLINVTQPANGTTYIKQMLIFGDANITILVNGIYPEAAKSSEAKIKDALLSTVYTTSQNDNPVEAAPFSVNIKDTELKLLRYMSGSLLYTTDGKIPTEKPTLIVGGSIAKVSMQDQKKYAEERLKKLPRGELNIIKEINEIAIDNLNGYEIIADGKTKDNKTALVYQVMLFNEAGDYYLIIGQAQEDFQKNIETFKRVAKTFKRK